MIHIVRRKTKDVDVTFFRISILSMKIVRNSKSVLTKPYLAFNKAIKCFVEPLTTRQYFRAFFQFQIGSGPYMLLLRWSVFVGPHLVFDTHNQM